MKPDRMRKHKAGSDEKPLKLRISGHLRDFAGEQREECCAAPQKLVIPRACGVSSTPAVFRFHHRLSLEYWITRLRG